MKSVNPRDIVESPYQDILYDVKQVDYVVRRLVITHMSGIIWDSITANFSLDDLHHGYMVSFVRDPIKNKTYTSLQLDSAYETLAI